MQNGISWTGMPQLQSRIEEEIVNSVNYVLRKPQPAPRSLSSATSSRGRLHVASTLVKRQIAWPMWATVTTLLVTSLVIPVVVNAQMTTISYVMHVQRLELP